MDSNHTLTVDSYQFNQLLPIPYSIQLIHFKTKNVGVDDEKGFIYHPSVKKVSFITFCNTHTPRVGSMPLLIGSV